MFNDGSVMMALNALGDARRNRELKQAEERAAMARQNNGTGRYGHQATAVNRQHGTNGQSAPVAKKHGYDFWHEEFLPWAFIVCLVIFLVAEAIGCLVGHPFAVIGVFIVAVGVITGVVALVYYGVGISIVIVALFTILYIIGKLF